jgi:murein DD-endopeptidase MepM/ murein hydrolase activator NlpD
MLKLAKINGLNPSGVLKIGQILRLDGTYEAKDENSERLAKTENILNSKQSQKIFFEKKYKIKKGDSLWSIACKFGIYVSTLEYINNTTSPVLKVGSYIKVSNVNYRPWIVKTTQKTKEFIKFFNITYDEFVKLNPKMKDKVEKGSKVYIPNKNPFWVKKIKVKTLNGGLLYWPTKGIIASPFGWRTHPIYKKRMFHNGIDIENKKNTKIVAVASGKVIFASYKGNSGKLVIILHRNGYQSIYAHLGKIKVKKGQWIKRGDLVGLMGDTGVSTGTHLHFGIRRYGKFLDPMDFLN